MNKEIHVPDIGDFQDVDVIEVLVAPGDTVAAEEPLATLESDKAAMEVPSPAAGVVKEVKIKVGDKVSQGSLLLLLEEAMGGPDTEAAPPVPDAHQESADEARAQPVLRRPPVPAVPAPFEVDARAFSKVHASPSVRRFARELGVDLGKIEGSGRKGRITKEDVQSFVKQVMSAQATAAPATLEGGSGIPPIPAVDFAKFGEIETQPLNKIKRLTGINLSRSWLNVPHVTHHDETDITEVEAFRRSLKNEAAEAGIRVTLLGFFMKAAAASLEAFPTFNASLDANGENLILKRYCHIGIAVETPNGLVVPVIRDVDRKNIFELSAELGEMSVKARERKLIPGEMQGACFTISSLGGIGGTAFTPIVNAPEVAILGLTRSQMKPLWNGTEFVPRLMQPMSLSYDHRVIDGAQAARFVKHLGALMSDIRRLLL